MANDSSFLSTVQRLVAKGDIRISEHGYEELAADGLFAMEVIDGVVGAILVKDYRCALFLQQSADGEPIHVVWGIPAGHDSPVVLITAYRPDPEKWEEGFTRRHP